jgi:homoserine dehydrogenase
VFQLLLMDGARPRPNICVTAVSDSSGGISVSATCTCTSGLPLSKILSWKQAGNRLSDFVNQDSDSEIIHHVDTMQMVKAVAKPSDIVLDATPVNLTDGGVGLACCRWAAQQGVHLVLANKAPLVLGYRELLHSSQQFPVSRLEFSGTVCGGLPVVNVGKRDLASTSRLDSVQGIFNSTSNYILSRMANGEDPADALAHARTVGIAEADASLDLQGYDTANKLVIICNAVLDIPAKLCDVDREGMTHLTLSDVKEAAKSGQVYRLVATAERIENEIEICDNDVDTEEEKRMRICSRFKLSVRPTLVPSDSFFGQCVDTDMSVVFISDEFETISMKTNEKGVFPTAAAMLRDCCSILKV